MAANGCHPAAPYHAWSMDFAADQLADGRRFCSPTALDTYTWECLAIESDQWVKGGNVVMVRDRIFKELTGNSRIRIKRP